MKRILLVALLLCPLFMMAQIPSYTMNAVQTNHGNGLKKGYGIDHSALVDFVKDAPELAILNYGGFVTRLKRNHAQDSLVLKTNNGNHTGKKTIDYIGKVAGDDFSVVALSFTIKSIEGMIYTAGHTYIVTRSMIYEDKDIETPKPPFECQQLVWSPSSTGKQSVIKYPSLAPYAATSIVPTKCVSWYWELDYNVFVALKTLDSVNSWVRAVFNTVQAFYARDSIKISLKSTYVWTSTSPYSGGTGNMLTQFKTLRAQTGWDGDLAHLISFTNNGGVAYVNGVIMCVYNPPGVYPHVGAQCGMSGVGSMYYADINHYNWTIDCIGHEMGHQMGSNHTHDCVWNGNNSRIDACGQYCGYDKYGWTCSVLPDSIPKNGGTIMSYCHVCTSVGTNFANGFGEQPRHRIWDMINMAANCLQCSGGCTYPSVPGAITGSLGGCIGAKLTYTINKIAGATSYKWRLPSTWSGSSTDTFIVATVGTSYGQVGVSGVNACGAGVERYIDVNATNCNPCVPKKQYRTVPCPAGYSGSGIIQVRDSSCTTGWGTWRDSVNNCFIICVDRDSTKKRLCPAGTSGTITDSGHYSCSTKLWSWFTKDSTCRVNNDTNYLTTCKFQLPSNDTIYYQIKDTLYASTQIVKNGLGEYVPYFIISRLDCKTCCSCTNHAWTWWLTRNGLTGKINIKSDIQRIYYNNYRKGDIITVEVSSPTRTLSKTCVKSQRHSITIK